MCVLCVCTYIHTYIIGNGGDAARATLYVCVMCVYIHTYINTHIIGNGGDAARATLYVCYVYIRITNN